MGCEIGTADLIFPCAANQASPGSFRTRGMRYLGREHYHLDKLQKLD
jgi:hypothetical protein